MRPGPYEILAPLGAGGMGEVYRAHDVGREGGTSFAVLELLDVEFRIDPRLRGLAGPPRFQALAERIGLDT